MPYYVYSDYIYFSNFEKSHLVYKNTLMGEIIINKLTTNILTNNEIS